GQNGKRTGASETSRSGERGTEAPRVLRIEWVRAGRVPGRNAHPHGHWARQVPAPSTTGYRVPFRPSRRARSEEALAALKRTDRRHSCNLREDGHSVTAAPWSDRSRR